MIYFDNSATSGYKPDCVINAVANTLKFVSANPGRSSHSMSMRCAALVYSVRKSFASFLGCQTERVIFTQNCTDALNTAIFGSVTSGGHVVTTAYEHNSVLRPLYELKRQGKISLTVLVPNDGGIVTADMIEKSIRYNTYLIAVNHVSNVTGAISPITEIGRLAKKHKILFLVDGAQSVGYTKIDMREQNIDMLAVAPHKGLHAPQGVGCLLLSDGVTLMPSRFGGTGSLSLSLTQPIDLPESLETGTLATPSIAGAGAGLKWSEQHFYQNQQTLRDLSAHFSQRLKGFKNLKIYSKPNSLSGIFSFNLINTSSQEVSDILSEQYGICTRAGLHCAPLIHKHLGTEKQGIVRVSLAPDNTQKEIDTFFSALTDISKFFD